MSYLNQFVRQCHSNMIRAGGPEIRAAISYLHKRHIKESTIKTNLIGYCSNNQPIPDEICFYGKDKSSFDGKGSGYAYFIKGKIIVPIYSEFGRLEGFATRKPSFEPNNTWWNISKPFHKGNHLFLLDSARKFIYEKNKIYIVEGYMDALYLAQEGLDNVVSLMGTQLTARKVALIARYCNNICVCLDVDENQAGQKAQDKAIYTLKKFDFHESISVIDNIPVGEDPDEFVAKNGLGKFLSMERHLTEGEISGIYNKVRMINKKRD